MSGNEFITLLGLTWDDDEVQRFLAKYGLAKKKPKLSPYSGAGYLTNKRLGLDITFRDEQDVPVKSKDYDEGTLVLTNIRMYGEGSTQGYEPFDGEFPHGLKGNFGLKEVQARLGKPAEAKKDVAMARWDLKGHAVFINFDKDHKLIRSAAVQLPVAAK